PARVGQRDQRQGHRAVARRRPDRRAQRRAVDGLFLLRRKRGVAFARHIDDPRSYYSRPADGACLRLPWVLGARLAQDGLQGPLPPAGATQARRLGACGALPFVIGWLNRLVRGKPLGASRPASARLPRQSANSLVVSTKLRPAVSVQDRPSAALNVL